MHMLGSQPLSMAEVSVRWNALTRTDPDYRLTLLMSDDWGFNTDHIRQVNRVLDEFLDTSSKREIRRIAAQVLAAEKSPQDIVDQWFTDEQRHRLRRLVDDMEVPDKLMVAFYARLEVHKAAEAAYLLQMHRGRPRPDFDSIFRTPEERADDLRWANAV